jgi:uncharacterized membrane protein
MQLSSHCYKVTSDHIVVTITLDTTVAFNTIVAFVIPLVALLMSLPMMWHKKHLWKFRVLQRVHLSNFVFILSLYSKLMQVLLKR